MEARRQAEAAQRDQAATAARRALEEAVKRNKAETELASDALREAGPDWPAIAQNLRRLARLVVRPLPTVDRCLA